VRTKLTVTQEKLDILQEQLRLKRLELRAAEEKLTFEQDNLEMRVVAAYKTSDLTYVDVVLASTSFEDLVSRTSVVHDLIGGNNDLVGDLEEARAVVEREKLAIAEREDAVQTAVADLQQQNDELVALRAAQAAQKAQSLATRKTKNGALASVRTDIAVLKRQEAQLLAESRQLTGIINGSSGGGGTGDMVRPVSGPVTSPFGYRIHPILHYRKLHTGIDYGVGYGSPIHAADSGTVIYATWMGGYGNVIMINHGGGISTLYAHQSSLAVGNGAHVTRGQTIGYVGSTGFSTGPHLHFEVRVNGNPVNPMGYIN
jgi:murein DD-endopeptidase MepM/ murein hydrolase activator NlpD